MDGPSDFDGWLLNPNSPNYLSSYPVSMERIDAEKYGDGLMKVELTLWDRVTEEDLPGSVIEGFTVIELSFEQSLELARELACTYFYFMDWNYTRNTFLVDVETGEKELIGSSPED